MAFHTAPPTNLLLAACYPRDSFRAPKLRDLGSVLKKRWKDAGNKQSWWPAAVPFLTLALKNTCQCSPRGSMGAPCGVVGEDGPVNSK